MLKKMSLRVRFTLVSSLFLLVSCTALLLLSNLSAESMMVAIVSPSFPVESIPMTQPEPASAMEMQPYHIFQKKTWIATAVIVVVGSIAAYFAAGYALRPIQMLSKEVKRRNASNLGEPLTLPQTSDEVQELTVSFNRMMAELQKSFLLQKQFSADAAHELRTPLAVMQAKLDVFALKNSGDSQINALISSLISSWSGCPDLLKICSGSVRTSLWKQWNQSLLILCFVMWRKNCPAYQRKKELPFKFSQPLAMCLGRTACWNVFSTIS